VGVLTRFPSNASYTSYRDRLCSVADLTVGRIEGKSIQNARFGGTFFHEVRAGDELLRRMSYFDYLVWAIGSHHSMKRVFPLHCAIPWLTLVKFGDFPHVESLMDPDWQFLVAPFYWLGDELDAGPYVSEALVDRMFFDLCVLRCLKQVVTTSGPIDLTEAFPAGLLGRPGFKERIVNGLVRVTGIPEFASREIMF